MRTRLAALTGPVLISAAALTLLAGCGSELGPDIHPGSAAVVEDVEVSFDEVDDYADALCEWQEPALRQDGLVWPMAYLKAVAMDSIVDDLLVQQFAEEKGLEPAAGYKETIAAIKKEVGEAKLPGDVGETVIDFRSRTVYHEAVMVSAGLAELADAGERVDQAAALQRGEEIFAKWRDSADVSIDPRFGAVEGEQLEYAAPGDALSVRVSDLAKGAEAGQNDKEYVDSLPAAQRCGGA